MENYNTIEVSNENRIGVISLNRPQVLNAINGQMVQEVTEAMHFLNNDESIACIILKGNGRWRKIEKMSGYTFNWRRKGIFCAEGRDTREDQH